MKKTIVLILVLILCAVSAALAEESSLPAFASFGEAEKASVLCASVFGKRNTTAVEAGGKLYGVVTESDDKAEELYDNYTQLHRTETEAREENLRIAFKVFHEYIRTLPVTEVFEITDVPLTEEEKKDLIGKPLREVCKMDDGVEFCYLDLTPPKEDDPLCFNLYRNSFIYSVYVNESREVFNNLKENEYKDKLTVREIQYLYPYVQ